MKKDKTRKNINTTYKGTLKASLKGKLSSSAYQIDQSGKIEFTGKNTVICLANGQVFTIKISAVEKRKLISTLKEIRKPNKTYAYDIFAALIYTILSKNATTEVEIDREYPGHEAGIKERIIQYFEKNNLKTPQVSFGLVGKKCKAHLYGLSVFQGKSRATSIVTAQDILEVILSTKKGRRPQSSRGNP